jgi:hypothetical protein
MQEQKLEFIGRKVRNVVVGHRSSGSFALERRAQDDGVEQATANTEILAAPE